MEFWLGIEYLQPSPPPKHDPKDRCWNIKVNEDLPWIDPNKKKILPENNTMTWRFAAYGGMIDMKEMVFDLRRLLGLVEQEDDEEFRPGDPPAVVCIALDAKGMVSGDVNLASLPWAMGRIRAANGAPLDFTGFDGIDGVENALRKQVRDLLISRQVISASLAAALELDASQVSLRTFTREDMQFVLKYIFKAAGWTLPNGITEILRIKAIEVKRNSPSVDNNDTDILNSFVASDIRLVRKSIGERKFGKGLEQYLFGRAIDQRVDIVRDHCRQIVASTMPKFMPLGRWPSKYPLALAQQFAVNTIINDLTDQSGLFSINGPPGTGKTTLLRDVVAALVVERAQNMAVFSDPTKAFTGKIDVRDSKFPAYTINESLCGFGIVVASANNGAVENITKELPATKSIDAEGVFLDYFAAVAETLLAGADTKQRNPGSSWGIIAAILGSKERRNAFVQRFWFADSSKNDEEISDGFISFKTALQDLKATDLTWDDARASFLKAVTKAEAAIAARQADSEIIQKLDTAKAKEKQLAQQIKTMLAQRDDLKSTLRKTDDALTKARQVAFIANQAFSLRKDLSDAEGNLSRVRKNQPRDDEQSLLIRIKIKNEELNRLKLENSSAIRALEILRASAPSWFQRTFRPSTVKAWRKNCLDTSASIKHYTQTTQEKEASIDATKSRLKNLRKWQHSYNVDIMNYNHTKEAASKLSVNLSAPLSKLEQVCHESEKAAKIALQHRDNAQTALQDNINTEAHLRTELDRSAKIAKECNQHITDAGITTAQIKKWTLLDMDEDNRQKSAPWYDEHLFRLRHEVFITALTLHKAFILANEKKFKANLGYFADLMSGKYPQTAFSGGGRPLWETLFLVIPVISTTFASFSRLFDGMGEESLGWLLIDEAGQATPQAAAGAIWRAKRTVVVGDPIQIEPFVGLPSSAIEALRVRCNIENQWHPLNDSCQVLADRANRFGTTIKDQWVGSPLRVHRRCLDPMFKIANQIAYENLMVYGTLQNDTDATKQWFGESCWIDIPAEEADGHWIPKQGALAINLTRRIINMEGAAIAPDGKNNIFVISPFRKVSDTIKSNLYSFVKSDNRKIAGTVHTFQGKEADVVIFLLGGNPKTPGSITNFAAAKPNLLNVALTRARRRIYVIGDRNQWKRHTYFSTMAESLPVRSPDDILGYDQLPKNVNQNAI